MKDLAITTLDSRDKHFSRDFRRFNDQVVDRSSQIHDISRQIVDNVRYRGDAALVEYTNQFDDRNVTSATDLAVSADELADAWKQTNSNTKHLLDYVAERITKYHETERTWGFDGLQTFVDDDGNTFGQRQSAIENVGIYIPGGTATYPSTVMHTAIPAKIAGVKRIVVCVPAPRDRLNQMILAALHRAGIEEVWSVGGAQAIAAMAYGTESVPKVDLIVGPGNAYVAAAKQYVFGRTGIDSLAGPSEICIVNDGGGNPHWLALDLLAQAEHDEDARSTLISTSENTLGAVCQYLLDELQTLPRRDIAVASLRRCGLFILTKNLSEAASIANELAPEHLHLSVAEPRDLLTKIQNAGAIFLGQHSCEAFGDYVAGPSHVLPTGSTARHASPLSVATFLKRSSVVEIQPNGGNQIAKMTKELAELEGLHAHARSAAARSN